MPVRDSILALLFQALCTLALAAVHFGLWRQRRQAFHAGWAAAWLTYAARLVFISAYLAQRRPVWLFAHEAVTELSVLLLLWAALQFAAGARWRARYLAFGGLAIAWAYVAIYGIRSMAAAGITSALLLSAVTLGTGAVFWRRMRRAPSTGGRVLAWAFTLWGLHHLDYPILRAQGAGVLFGVCVDVSFLIAVAVGTLTLVLGEERAALAQRTAQLEQLTALLLRAQEEERLRLARDLHDEAGQALTALRIELDLAGQRAAGERVGEVLGHIRDLSERLRPRALDDLGLVPALRALVEDFGARTRIAVECEADERAGWPPETAAVLYRVAQEALTNVARHSGAAHAWVRLSRGADGVRLVVEDDGRGAADPEPHLGLLGMRERVATAGGALRVARARHGGLRVEARLPAAEGA